MCSLLEWDFIFILSLCGRSLSLCKNRHKINKRKDDCGFLLETATWTGFEPGFSPALLSTAPSFNCMQHWTPPSHFNPGFTLSPHPSCTSTSWSLLSALESIFTKPPVGLIYVSVHSSVSITGTIHLFSALYEFLRTAGALREYQCLNHLSCYPWDDPFDHVTLLWTLFCCPTA